ncbi:MAG: response regulator transcription factor [Chloroflexi bacterium]|nr:response regulator transcription factor [Chloroflexota bacterium]
MSTALGEEPAPRLEAALRLFLQVNMPLELAQTRLALAEALAGREPHLAAAEARAALAAFEGLGAPRDADAAGRLLRQLGAAGRAGPRRLGVLSRRQQEVLELLGLGFSNERIAARLYISRRTAEHHVAAILARLGLATRAEAAAYTIRHAPQKSVRD